MQATITNKSAADAVKRLKSKPPFAIGLSRKSPTTAPSGRVKIKADQNKAVLDTLVK